MVPRGQLLTLVARTLAAYQMPLAEPSTRLPLPLSHQHKQLRGLFNTIKPPSHRWHPQRLRSRLNPQLGRWRTEHGLHACSTPT